MKFIKSLTVRMKLLQVLVKYLRTRIKMGTIFENQKKTGTIFENQKKQARYLRARITTGTIFENQNNNRHNI